MAEFRTELGSSATYELKSAVLIYHGAGGGFATVHSIEGKGKDGRLTETPRLSAGRPMTTGELRDALATIDNVQSERIAILPANLLAFAPGTLCWFRPAAPATLWFSITDDHGKPDKKHPLMPLSGSKFPMPGLVFLVKDHSLHVYAVKGAGPARHFIKPNAFAAVKARLESRRPVNLRTNFKVKLTSTRPTAKTRLHPAPFWNTNEHGLVCTGNMRMPSAPSPGSIPDIEKAFFQSNFTHSNGKNHHGDHDALWRAARKARAFPELLLFKPTTTLAKILSQ